MTSPSKDPRPFRIVPNVANPVLKKTLLLTRGFLEHSLKLAELDRIYQQSLALTADMPFIDKVLRIMNVRYTMTEQDRARIPSEGPVVLVANHPFGGIEGCILIAALSEVRPDVKIMANYLLGRIPELRDYFIFVDPFGSRKSTRTNIRPLKESMSWLKKGGLLASFPAGEVSSVDLRTGKVRDPAWSPTIASLVRRSEATVVPVFFAGHNGPLFQLAGLMHPRFRTLLLPGQVVNKRNRCIELRVGAAIPWREIKSYDDDNDLIRYLRLRTYIQAERQEPHPKRLRRLPTQRKSAAPSHAPLADPEPFELCAAEIAALPAEQKMVETGDMDVYIALAAQAPSVMREIGRLREMTFRLVGEGTGQSRDLDVYDEYYLHLFIWNHKKQEVVGAYRLGMADAICDKYGTKGLYTRTLFRFNTKLLDCLQPAIELGRSFVRPEYQKAYASLLLLWKGIAAFIARNPRYRTLFGPVSITNEYRDASRNLMLRSLRLSNFAPELARLVRPRKRAPRARRAEWNRPDFADLIDDIDQVSDMIQDIEHDRKGIPILLRQYLKLGGRILAFNVDPAFSSVVDGLIAIELTETDPKTLRRYMGKANAETFLRHHGIEPD